MYGRCDVRSKQIFNLWRGDMKKRASTYQTDHFLSTFTDTDQCMECLPDSIIIPAEPKSSGCYIASDILPGRILE